MQFKRKSVEFEVSSVDEIKLLLDAWRQVLARFQGGRAIHERLTQYHLVYTKLDDRVTPEEVLVLQIIGKPEMIDQLIEEIKARGLSCSSITLIPGLVTRCRLER
jgi:hypothetical protein